MRPTLFIGSSSESLQVVDAIQSNLQRDVQVIPWTQGVFQLSEDALTSLLDQLGQVDFAAFVLAPDDVAKIRKREFMVARDNVIFELGLFMGRLGRGRCFIVKPQDAGDLHVPSDFSFLTAAQYDGELLATNPKAALGGACGEIRQRIQALWQSEQSLSQDVEGTWLEIKSGVERPYALMEFRAKGDEVDIKGRSYDAEGNPGVAWPHGEVNFSVCKGNSILHCYDAQFAGAEGWNHTHGVAHFEFEPRGPRRNGRGYYVAHNDGKNLRSGRVDFRLLKVTRELVRFTIAQDELKSDQDRVRFVKAFAEHNTLRRVVITGGSCAGKTSLIEWFRARGHKVTGEAASVVIEQAVRTRGIEGFHKWRDADQAAFQRLVFDRQRQIERACLPAQRVFMDRTGADCIAYLKYAGLEPPAEMLVYAQQMACDAIFVLDTLFPFQARPESGRTTTYDDSLRIRDALMDLYSQLGHLPILVPADSLESRGAFILDRLAGASPRT